LILLSIGLFYIVSTPTLVRIVRFVCCCQHPFASSVFHLLLFSRYQQTTPKSNIRTSLYCLLDTNYFYWYVRANQTSRVEGGSQWKSLCDIKLFRKVLFYIRNIFSLNTRLLSKSIGSVADNTFTERVVYIRDLYDTVNG
jgi:hypothetical protein